MYVHLRFFSSLSLAFSLSFLLSLSVYVCFYLSPSLSFFLFLSVSVCVSPSPSPSPLFLYHCLSLSNSLSLSLSLCRPHLFLSSHHIFYFLSTSAPVVSTGSNTWASRRLGCVGVPLDNLTVKILNPVTLEEVEEGTDGEVCLRSCDMIVI